MQVPDVLGQLWHGSCVFAFWHDTRKLMSSDCLLLRDQEWLNDQVMAFYFEYLRQEAFPNIRDDLLLIDPSTAFMLTSLPAESAPLLLQPLQASSKLMVRQACPGQLSGRTNSA